MAYFQLCNIFAKKISRMRIVGLGNALTDVLARLHSDECFDEMAAERRYATYRRRKAFENYVGFRRAGNHLSIRRVGR